MSGEKRKIMGCKMYDVGIGYFATVCVHLK